MERKSGAELRGKYNSHSDSTSDHSSRIPRQQQSTVAAASPNSCRVRGEMSKPTISNYDKYPLVRVSDSRDGCETGWDAIGRRLKASIRPGRFVICVECYPGCWPSDAGR